MKRRNGAFSLLEALVTLGLVFLVLGLALDLFNQYSGILRFSAAKSTSLTTMQVALQQLVDDARQAQTIETPAAVGAAASELKFIKVDSSNPTWLTNTTLSGSWVPVLTTDTMPYFVEVRYYLSDGTTYPVGSLLRDVGPPGAAPTSTWEVAQNIAGMQATGLQSWNGAGLNAVQIQLTLRESNRTVVVTGSSMRPPL